MAYSAKKDATVTYDAGVEAAVDIQNLINDSSTSEVAADAIARLGPLADAYSFWQTGDAAKQKPNENPDQWTTLYGPLTAQGIAMAELEGFILAGKTPKLIAARTGLSEEAVDWYESIWFDVRDRLRYTSWILSNVIGSLHQGTIGTLLPALIRSYGYQSKSARVVSAVASGFDAKSARAAGKNPETFFAADALFAGSLKANLAIRLMPLNDRRTYARVVELHQEATRIASDTATGAGTDAENKLREAAKYLGQQIKFQYGKAPPAEISNARLLRLNPPTDASTDAG